MRILFALPGFHRYERGAEVALMSLARELARGGDEVTLIGSGEDGLDANQPYRFIHAGSVRRERFERWPGVPLLRGETAYEELTFAPGLAARYRPGDYDVTATCSFPFTNLILRRPAAHRPLHVFITQNGDWPARSDDAEFRLFGCDGLVCTNPDYFESNRDRWRCALIPNGLDTRRFSPGPRDRAAFGLPHDRPVVLMVSALIASKRVADGIRSVAELPDAHLVVAGDGPLRDEIDALAARLLPGRFTRLTVPAARMPDLYRTADVFLHLSKAESFGNVYIEALACGLPVVGDDSPRLRWIVADQAFLTDTDDPAHVADAIAAALASPVDARQARQRYAERFAWPAVATQYRTFFQQLIDERAQGG